MFLCQIKNLDAQPENYDLNENLSNLDNQTENSYLNEIISSVCFYCIKTEYNPFDREKFKQISTNDFEESIKEDFKKIGTNKEKDNLIVFSLDLKENKKEELTFSCPNNYKELYYNVLKTFKIFNKKKVINCFFLNKNNQDISNISIIVVLQFLD